jgi:hypothetical protein
MQLRQCAARFALFTVFLVGSFSLIGAEDLHATHQDDASPRLHVTADAKTDVQEEDGKADETLSTSEEVTTDLQTSMESASGWASWRRRRRRRRSSIFEPEKDYGTCPTEITRYAVYKMIRQKGDCFEVMDHCGFWKCVQDCPGSCSWFDGAPNACLNVMGEVCCPCSEPDKKGYIERKVRELWEGSTALSNRAKAGNHQKILFATEMMSQCMEAKCSNKKGEETKLIQSLKKDPLLELLADVSSGKETTQVLDTYKQ